MADASLRRAVAFQQGAGILASKLSESKVPIFGLPPSIQRKLWQGHNVLPREQSFLAKPVDEEIVQRVRSSLEKFPGVKNGEERERLIRDKAAAKDKPERAASEAYLAWARKVKTEAVPCFMLPEDPLVPKRTLTNEEYIQQKVQVGKQDMQEQDEDYRHWLEDMLSHQNVALQDKVKAKLAADREYNAEIVDRERDRVRLGAAAQAAAGQQQSQYWKWLRVMKEEVASRPSPLPAVKVSEVESIEAMAAKKKKERLYYEKEIKQEHDQWLQSVSKPKLKLPYHEVVSWEEQKKRAAAHKEKLDEQHKATQEYFKQLEQFKQKHHKRIMQSVRQKLQADQEYAEDQAAEAEALVNLREERKQRRRKIALQGQQELREMRNRVKAKPLFLESAYAGA